jgi:hypothetical protein
VHDTEIIIPAQPGIQGEQLAVGRWTPAFAGVTVFELPDYA